MEMDAHASNCKIGAFLFMNQEQTKISTEANRGLINTPLQGGGLGAREVWNRFNPDFALSFARKPESINLGWAAGSCAS